MVSLSRFLDVRPTEVRPVVATFGSLLFIVVAHTLLETARDALFLVHVGPGALGWMYIATAAVTLVLGGLGARIVARLGARRALTVTQLGSGLGVSAFFFLPPTPAVLVAMYAFGAVSAALVVPQLWATAGALFHVGQARRLFGVIAIAGVLGAVVGTSTAALALLVTHVRSLLLLSAIAFVVANVFIGLAPDRRGRPVDEARETTGSWWSALRAEPVLWRLALAVALGAMTTLLADYIFKAVAVTRVPSDQLGSFLARWYTAMNALALVIQLVAARRLLARVGVVGTAGFTPTLMLIGSGLTFVTGGALFAVVGTKIADAALRHSIHRTGLELVYLAIPAKARDRARPVIDGAISRLSQAAAAGLVLVLFELGRRSPRELALLATLCAAGWALVTVSLRGPYVALFRHALLGPNREEPRSAQELDLASVEVLIEALSSPRPREVVASMDALSRRGRTGLIPGLVLLREEEDVLEHALELFGGSARADWQGFARKLVTHRAERVQRAALRALARSRRRRAETEGVSTAIEQRPWIRGYLAVGATADGDDAVDPLALLVPGNDGKEAALGMFTALRDAHPSPRLVSLLRSILVRGREHLGHDTVELVARAAAAVHATVMVPDLTLLLTAREGRAAVRATLVAFGEPAFEELARLLGQPATPRALRSRLPLAIAAFGTQRAADLLLEHTESANDGFIRYRCLRALERMAVDAGVDLPHRTVRRLALRDLVESFRLLALRLDLEVSSTGSTAERVLVRLLDEKRDQALVRVFRLLRLAFPAEDFQEVRAAAVSDDAAKRANAAEFLDALLAQRRRAPNDDLRGLLRLLTEDLPDTERVARAGAITILPSGKGPVAARLREDADGMLSAVAGGLLGS